MERKRLLWAALLLLAVGGGLLARRKLSSSAGEAAPQPVVFSADGSARLSSALRRFAALLGQDAGSPVAMGDLRRVLAAAGEDPVARPFAEQFLAEPVLRKAWEEHRDEEDAGGFAKDVAETPELAKLLDRWQQDPGFVALTERMVETLERQAARGSASSDRVLLSRAPAGAARAARAVASRVSPLAAAPRSAQAHFGLTEPPRHGPAAHELEAVPSVRRARRDDPARSAPPAEPGETPGPSPDAKVIVAGAPPPEGDAPPPAEVPGGSEDSTAPLGKLAETSSVTMNADLKRWLATYGLSAAVYMGDTGGIWDVCFQRRELAKCDAACRAVPAASSMAKQLCSRPPGGYWQACQEAGYTESQCLRECSNQAPCVVSKSAYWRLCASHLQPPPDRGYDPNCMFVPGFREQLAGAFPSDNKDRRHECPDGSTNRLTCGR